MTSDPWHVFGTEDTAPPGACATPDEAGIVACERPARWRVSLTDQPEWWDVCHDHVADALLNVDGCWAGGAPVLVRYLGASSA